MRQQTIVAELRRHLVEVRPDPCYDGLEVGGGGGPGGNALCHLIAQVENVVALDFALTDIADDGFSELAKLRGVRRLEMYSRQLTTKSLATLELFTELREVKLGVNIDGDLLASSFAKLPHLQRVRICNRGLTPNGLRFALHCPDLQYLDISCNPVSEGFDVLRMCPALWKLDVDTCGPISEKGIEQISELHSVTDLVIGECGVNDRMMAHIAERMPQLRKLFIAPSPMTPASAGVLPQLSSLENLMWPSEAVDRSNLAAFAALPALRRLTFWFEPKIPKHVLSEIQRLMPGCQIFS